MTRSIDATSQLLRLRSGATVVIAIAALLILGLAVTNVVLWRSVDQVESDVASIRSDIAAGERPDTELGERLDAFGTELDALGERINLLEGDVVAEFDPVALADRVTPSIFMVVAHGGDEWTSVGTGFVLAKDGRRSLVVTNYHVVEGASEVFLVRGRREYVGEIVRVRPAHDLALITVSADLPALEPADTPPRVGDPVMAVGAGAGLEGTVTVGIVSAVDRRVDTETWLQISAQISPGNSGGPILNTQGQVIGVATWKVGLIAYEGLGFAIPIDRVCFELDIC
jgi:putative serine protease PepD